AEPAAGFVGGGRHLWNLGLFAWPAAVFLGELRAADAGLGEAIDGVVEARERGDETRAGAIYRALTPVPVEPLVLERTRRLTVVEAAFAWSDLGSWADLHEARVDEGGADPAGNVVDGDAVLLAARDTTVEARARRLV